MTTELDHADVLLALQCETITPPQAAALLSVNEFSLSDLRNRVCHTVLTEARKFHPASGEPCEWYDYTVRTGMSGVLCRANSRRDAIEQLELWQRKPEFRGHDISICRQLARPDGSSGEWEFSADGEHWLAWREVNGECDTT